MMKFIDDLKYHLHILEAMSFGRADGIDEVNNYLNQILDHLVKIAIYSYQKDRADQVEHWEGGIAGWLSRINRKCNNLKKGNNLKFKDYMLCLQDDLCRDDLVYRSVRRAKKLMKTDRVVEPNISELRKTLWTILETQFKAMADGSWDDEVLTENELFKELSS